MYCIAWSPGLAGNQHDLWRPNPRHDRDVFRDRPVVIIEDASLVEAARPGSRCLRRRPWPWRDRACWSIAGDQSHHHLDVAVYRNFAGLPNVEANRELLQTYATPAYYAAQGGTPVAFVVGLYRDLLGRAPRARGAGTTGWPC